LLASSTRRPQLPPRAPASTRLARPPTQLPYGFGGSWKDSNKMAYFFSTPVDIDIVLDDGDDRQMVDMKTEKGRREKAPLYKDGESVKGAVTIRPKDGKRLEHTGIKVQFIGTIGMPPGRLAEY
jgi:Vacuolar protein sorting-associated protein 26